MNFLKVVGFLEEWRRRSPNLARLGTSDPRFGPKSEILQLQYEVEQITEVENFELGPDVDREQFNEDLTGLWSALGLAVQAFDRGRISVNLIPETIVRKKEARRRKPWLVASTSLVILAMAVFAVAEMVYGQKIAEKPEEAVQLAEQIESYESSLSEEKSTVEDKKERLKSITTTEVPRGLFLQIVPTFASYLPQNVFLTEVHFAWVSQSEVEQIKQGNVTGPFEQAGTQRGGMGGRGGTRSQPPSGAGYGARSGGSGTGMRRGAAPEEEKAAEHGIDSRLVLWFEAESARRQQGLQYIKQNVFAPLRKMQLPGADQKAFSEVEMVGEASEIYRSSLDGRIISEGDGGSRGRRSGARSGGRGGRRGRTLRGRSRGMGGPRMGQGQEEGQSGPEEQEIYFLRFRGYALLDLGQEKQTEGTGSGAGTTSTGSAPSAPQRAPSSPGSAPASSGGSESGGEGSSSESGTGSTKGGAGLGG